MGIATSSRSLMSGRIRLHYASILISTLALLANERKNAKQLAPPGRLWHEGARFHSSIVGAPLAGALEGRLWGDPHRIVFSIKGRATQTSAQNLLLNQQLVRRPSVEPPRLAQGYHYGLPVLTTRFSLTLAAYQSI